MQLWVLFEGNASFIGDNDCISSYEVELLFIRKLLHRDGNM